MGAYDAIDRRADEMGLPVRVKNKEVLDAGQGSLVLAEQHGIPIGFGSDTWAIWSMSNWSG